MKLDAFWITYFWAIFLAEANKEGAAVISVKLLHSEILDFYIKLNRK